MKRSFRRSLLVLLVLGIGLAGAALSAQDSKPFIGDWKGAIFIQGMELGLIAHFTLDENKNIAGTLDSPSQNAYGLKLADIKIEGKKITFRIDSPGAPGNPTFSGESDAAGMKITGDFSQGNATGTFSFEKQK